MSAWTWCLNRDCPEERDNTFLQNVVEHKSECNESIRKSQYGYLTQRNLPTSEIFCFIFEFFHDAVFMYFEMNLPLSLARPFPLRNFIISLQTLLFKLFNRLYHRNKNIPTRIVCANYHCLWRRMTMLSGCYCLCCHRYSFYCFSVKIYCSVPLRNPVSLYGPKHRGRSKVRRADVFWVRFGGTCCLGEYESCTMP
jgi:hypothetical protein